MLGWFHNVVSERIHRDKKVQGVKFVITLQERREAWRGDTPALRDGGFELLLVYNWI